MNANTEGRSARWSFFLQWILASFVGLAMGHFIIQVDENGTLTYFVAGALLGTMP